MKIKLTMIKFTIKAFLSRFRRKPKDNPTDSQAPPMHYNCRCAVVALPAGVAAQLSKEQLGASGKIDYAFNYHPDCVKLRKNHAYC